MSVTRCGLAGRARMAAARAKAGWHSAAGAGPMTWATAQEQGVGGERSRPGLGRQLLLGRNKKEGEEAFLFIFKLS